MLKLGLEFLFGRRKSNYWVNTAKIQIASLTAVKNACDSAGTRNFQTLALLTSSVRVGQVAQPQHTCKAIVSNLRHVAALSYTLLLVLAYRPIGQ